MTSSPVLTNLLHMGSNQLSRFTARRGKEVEASCVHARVVRSGDSEAEEGQLEADSAGQRRTDGPPARVRSCYAGHMTATCPPSSESESPTRTVWHAYHLFLPISPFSRNIRKFVSYRQQHNLWSQCAKRTPLRKRDMMANSEPGSLVSGGPPGTDRHQ